MSDAAISSRVPSRSSRDIEDHRELALRAPPSASASWSPRLAAIDQERRRVPRARRLASIGDRLAAIAAVAGAERAVARHHDDVAGAGPDRAEELGVDAGIPQRGARELAEQVGAMGADRPGPAAQPEGRTQRDRDAGRRGGGEGRQLGGAASTPGRFGPRPEIATPMRPSPTTRGACTAAIITRARRGP